VYGVDLNGDHTIQRNELQRLIRSTGINQADPTAPSITRRVDYDMKVPTTDEFLIGFERELLTDFAVGMNYTYRKYNDLYWTNFEKTFGKGDFYTAADYVLAKYPCPAATPNCASNDVVAGGTFTLTDPLTGAVLATFPTKTVPVYQLAPGLAAPAFRVVTTRKDYSQRYSGLEVTATKRMSHNWMLRANATFNDYTEKCSGAASQRNPTPLLPAVSNASNNCIGGQLAPQSAGSGAFGNDFVNAKWNFNVTSAVQLPWDFNVGASLTARQGYPAVLRDNVTGIAGGTVAAILNPVGDVRFDNVYELDLRVAKDFRFMNRLGFTVSADLFNAPNKRTVLQRETLILNTVGNSTAASSNPAAAKSSRAAGWRITELQAPRVWRIGGKFTF
jgi:hypothetical protein